MKSFSLGFLCLIGYLLTSYTTLASDTTRVLFIGNSFTYMNNVPDIIKGLAQEGGIPMLYSMHAPGGATIGDTVQGDFAHMENPQVFQLIRQGNWDYVIVQDNQGRFIYDYGVFHPMARTIEGHKRVMDSTMHYNSCATMIWFSGWAFKDGALPYASTGIELINRIDANYKFMNNILDQMIAPIGAAWKRSVTANPSLDLWHSDAAHASPSGSYLAASVLFSSIFRRDPGPLQFDNGLNAAQAANLRKIAYETFVDSFARDNAAEFTLPLNYTSGALVTSSGYTTYHYYRNGVKVASTSNNTYTAAPGDCYQVIAEDGDGCRHFSLENCPKPTAITGTTEEYKFRVYPNPTRDFVTIAGNQYARPVQVTVYDMMGRAVYTTSWEQETRQLDLSSLQAGSYIIRFQIDSKSWKASLLKQ